LVAKLKEILSVSALKKQQIAAAKKNLEALNATIEATEAQMSMFDKRFEMPEAFKDAVELNEEEMAEIVQYYKGYVEVNESKEPHP
jgi:cell division protein FtsB